MIYIVDIDNTICDTVNSDYENSTPIPDRIKKINELYNSNTIIYWTARGMASGRDIEELQILTENSLKDWGCNYHELRMQKPQYDVWIDDKADWIFRENGEEE